MSLFIINLICVVLLCLCMLTKFIKGKWLQRQTKGNKHGETLFLFQMNGLLEKIHFNQNIANSSEATTPYLVEATCFAHLDFGILRHSSLQILSGYRHAPGNLRCIRILSVALSRSEPRYNPLSVSELWKQFFGPHGLVFTLILWAVRP